MQEPTSERTVTLSDSSWELLDAASEMDGKWSPSEFLNSLVQGYLVDDGGATIKTAQAKIALQELFGENRG